MNQEVKAQWVAALRSGEYTQIRGALRGEDWGPKCMCVLGVLVDVVDGWADQEAEREGAVLVRSVLQRVGLPSYYARHSPLVEYEGGRFRIAELNDCRGLSFNQLADLIEVQL